MYHALVCCRAGMGSSMMLKIKADQVIKAHGWPIATRPGNLSALRAFSGDAVLTMTDLVDEVRERGTYAIGVDDILDVAQIEEGLRGFLVSKGEDPDAFAPTEE